jgi:hypothetical protein
LLPVADAAATSSSASSFVKPNCNADSEEDDDDDGKDAVEADERFRRADRVMDDF